MSKEELTMIEPTLSPDENNDLHQQTQIYEQVTALSQDVQNKLAEGEKTIISAETDFANENYLIARDKYDQACQVLSDAEQTRRKLEEMDPSSMYRHAKDLRTQALENK